MEVYSKNKKILKKDDIEYEDQFADDEPSDKEESKYS